MPGDTVRQRSSKPSPTTKATPVNDQAEDISYELEETSPVISVLDVIRIIFTICAASCAFSYYITSGESVLWGYRPWITRPDLVKAYLVSSGLSLLCMVQSFPSFIRIHELHPLTLFVSCYVERTTTLYT